MRKVIFKSFSDLKHRFFSSIFLASFFLMLLCFTIFSDYLIRFYFSGVDSFLLLIVKASLMLLLVCPLYYGTFLWFCETSKRYRHHFLEAFGFFTSIKLIFRSIIHFITKLLLFSFYVLPSIILAFASVFCFNIALNFSDIRLVFLGACVLIISLCVFILGLISYTKYSLSDYIFVTCPDLSVFSSFSLSRKCTKGMLSHLFLYKLKLFLLSAVLIFIAPVAFCINNLALSKIYCNLYEQSPRID